ncbi:MAG: hypothetical protein OEV70_16200 [Nitrospirota bacterium]|nr:hypothetical protein [Nitrospirota bacterium]
MKRRKWDAKTKATIVLARIIHDEPNQASSSNIRRAIKPMSGACRPHVDRSFPLARWSET